MNNLFADVHILSKTYRFRKDWLKRRWFVSRKNGDRHLTINILATSLFGLGNKRKQNILIFFESFCRYLLIVTLHPVQFYNVLVFL